MFDTLPTVLLVEDEDELRLSFRDFLKRKGLVVHVASDGVGALKLILDHPIDVVVTDYRMEIFGGDYWMRFLRRYCSNLDIILTSGFLQPDIDMFFEMILKPFDYQELYDKILERYARRKGGPD